MPGMQPPLYQLATSPGGTWRVRVFNLPDQTPVPALSPGARPAPVPVPAPVPFLLTLATSSDRPRHDWQRDPAGQLTVLRLAGPDTASLSRLLNQLRSHGINRVGAENGGAVSG